MGNKVRFSVKWLVIPLFVLLLSVSCKTKETAVYPQAMEIIGDIPTEAFLQLLEQQGLDANSAYRWNDHYLIYNLPENAEQFKQNLTTLYPSVVIKEYKNPFYVFDRTKCNDRPVERAVDYKILTANLVSDPQLQEEYMTYHKNQFKEFPEVSQGFCRAEFQQLLIFRNGAQLVLVISYPAGKDYDTLNARTVENNPRVDEWNSLMAKYQEGIKGTLPGETWVFFEPVTAGITAVGQEEELGTDSGNETAPETATQQ